MDSLPCCAESFRKQVSTYNNRYTLYLLYKYLVSISVSNIFIQYTNDAHRIWVQIDYHYIFFSSRLFIYKYWPAETSDISSRLNLLKLLYLLYSILFQYFHLFDCFNKRLAFKNCRWYRKNINFIGKFKLFECLYILLIIYSIWFC